MPRPTIQVRELRKSFATNNVLDGVDLTVQRGEVFALLGPNGSGKTTTINVLTTLTRSDSGEAHVLGYDVNRSPTEVQKRIAVTGQSAAVDDQLTGTENLRMFARLAGLGRRAAAMRSAELLEQFQLTQAATRRVREYSGGMRRRLDLAISFVCIPDVLFLDEPTTGLDTRSRRELWDIIRTLTMNGTTVFLTTQYLEEADQLADHIAVLNHGRIVALGTSDVLKAHIGGDTVQLRDDNGDLIREEATDGTVSGLRQALDLLDESGVVGNVSLKRPSLDDVFLSLTNTKDK